MPFEIDRRAFIASLGGATAVNLMSHEARADALEDYSIHKLDEVVTQAQAGQNAGAPEKFPTMAELEARIDGSANRRGAGNLFVASANRPVPPVMVKTSTMETTLGVPDGVDCPRMSAKSRSPLAAMNSTDPMPTRFKRLTSAS